MLYGLLAITYAFPTPPSLQDSQLVSLQRCGLFQIKQPSTENPIENSGTTNLDGALRIFDQPLSRPDQSPKRVDMTSSKEEKLASIQDTLNFWHLKPEPVSSEGGVTAVAYPLARPISIRRKTQSDYIIGRTCISMWHQVR